MTESLFNPKQNTNVADELKNHAPTIAFVAGNLLLIVGEWRVFDYALVQTGEVWKAWFAVLASFLPFAIWEIAVQHDKANGWMRVFAWLGMVISMALGIIVGVADFIMIDGHSPNSNALLTWLALSLSVHAILLLAYFYSHPEIKAKRLMAEALAGESLALTNARIARNILEAARGRLTHERAIANEFGEEELRKVLASLTGQKYIEPDTVRSQPAQASALSLDLARRSSSLAPLPTSKVNGNGSHAEPEGPFAS